jgi:phage/plasmid-like protein (TIGR03299 family)
MAHELEVLSDGSASFFSAKKVPWHRLGTVTDGALTAAEAIKAARMDWEVRLVPTYARDDVTGAWILDEANRHVVRDNPDPGDITLPILLGVVGRTYRPIQNVEAFTFLDTLVDEAGAYYETAGVLQNGQRIFVTMKMPDGIRLTCDGVEDLTEVYLLCTTSHDGSFSFTVAIVPLRVVCMNTLRIALAKARSLWAVKHTQGAAGKIAEARQALGLTFTYMGEWEALANQMASKVISDPDWQSVLDAMWPTDSDSKRANTINGDRQDQVKSIYANSPSMLGWKGTQWGALNAITEWLDHSRPVLHSATTAGMSDDERRAVGTLYSAPVDDLRQKAFKLLTSV